MAKENKKDFLVQSQIIRNLSHDEYFLLSKLCFFSNCLFNVGLYNVRQHYFETKKYLSYPSNCKIAKTNENFKFLQAGIAQQTLKKVDLAMKSFFALLKLKLAGEYDKDVRLPHYRKKGGLFSLTLSTNAIHIKNGQLALPFSRTFKKVFCPKKTTLPVPANLLNKKIQEVRITSIYDGKFFKIDYVYEAEPESKHLNPENKLAIDIGLENLATCITTTGASFIMDGRKLKSINQLWNKKIAKFKSILDKQAHGKRHGSSKRIACLNIKRNNRTKDILNKTARYIVNYCIAHDIGTIICGCNKEQKQGIELGNTNQDFVQVEFSRLRRQLTNICKRYGIQYIEQEESYTSKASCLDLDEIPVFDPDDKTVHTFSGKRVKRGLYRFADGRTANADINGAANILRKSKQKFDFEQLCRGLLASPSRIRVG